MGRTEGSETLQLVYKTKNAFICKTNEYMYMYLHTPYKHTNTIPDTRQ